MSASRKQYIISVIISSVSMLSGCTSSSLTGNSVIAQISPASALLALGQNFQFTAVTNVPNATNFMWQVNGVVGGSSSTGTITTTGVYTAPSTPTSQPVQIGIRSQTATASVSMFNPKNPTPGSVAATQNPLVAQYTMAIPAGATIQVQFGTDTTYGLNTSSVSSVGGGTETIYVAGMRASTPYHMQALVTLADGSQVKDADHTFVTGAFPARRLPTITTQLTGEVEQLSPGIEMLDLIPQAATNVMTTVATDLSGNVIWYYDLPIGSYPDPIKLLPNGNLLMVVTDTATVSDVREVDLAGNIIYEVTSTTINQALARIVPYAVQSLNHDVLKLPNGHLILLASIVEPANGVPGVPNGTAVVGNALIDWDLQTGPVWTWSTFDHLSLSRAPYGLPDWTHGNALAYSANDGNLLFSLRNQNWVLKINYQNGSGDGSIIWRLGPGGDFALPNGQAPIEWNYGQHFLTFQSPNTSGVFSLMFFNNGNNRLVDSNNDVCGTAGFVACYSSVPIFELNEYTMAASVTWEQKLAPAYSICCGDALVLPNGDVEFDVAYDVYTPGESYVEEVTKTDAPELLWRMDIPGVIAYRAFRMPSLYPDQVWPANAQNLRVAGAQH